MNYTSMQETRKTMEGEEEEDGFTYPREISCWSLICVRSNSSRRSSAPDPSPETNSYEIPRRDADQSNSSPETHGHAPQAKGRLNRRRTERRGGIPNLLSRGFAPRGNSGVWGVKSSSHGFPNARLSNPRKACPVGLPPGE